MNEVSHSRKPADLLKTERSGRSWCSGRRSALNGVAKGLKSRMMMKQVTGTCCEWGTGIRSSGGKVSHIFKHCVENAAVG